MFLWKISLKQIVYYNKNFVENTFAFSVSYSNVPVF